MTALKQASIRSASCSIGMGTTIGPQRARTVAASWALATSQSEGAPMAPSRARRSDSRLRLEVEDDGVGIPESRLATLLEQGIGVSNVNERLKVLFGNDYRMWIDSRPGEGTRIRIDAPELHVETPAG